MPPQLLAVAPTGSVSGAERVLLRSLARAIDDGWRVSCAAPAGSLAAELAARGIPQVQIPELTSLPGPRLVAIFRLVWRALAAARRLRGPLVDTDVVLVNGLAGLAPLALLRRRPPVAWLVHDVVVRRDRRMLVRACAHTVDLAIAVSQSVSDALAGFGISRAVVRNGTQWPVEPAAPVSPPIVGCNAALTPWKGHSVLLDAVAKLDRDDVSVELLGTGFPKDAAYVDGLRRQVADRGLQDCVEFVGHVGDPLATMRRWTIAVSASVEPEAGPLNVLEAMSLGVPLVGTDHGGTPEVLDGAGLLVPPNDAEALSVAVQTLLDDEDLRDQCGTAGRRAIADGLTIDGQLAELLETVAALADGREKAPRGSDSASSGPEKVRGTAAAAHLLVRRRPTTSGGVILAYHDITAGAETRYDLSVERFERQLRWIRSWGFEFLALDELVRRSLAGEGTGAVSVVFDDGLAGVHARALPLLESQRIPATVFVCSGLLGEAPPWVRPGSRLMTGDEIRHLVDTGIQIGSHAESHASLPDCDNATLHDELAGSRVAIAEITGTTPTDLAYPFGHFDQRVVDAAVAAGYERAFTFRNGRVTPGTDPHRIPRLTMHSRLFGARLAYSLARGASTWPDPQPESMPPLE